jgi:hypothetical protein
MNMHRPAMLHQRRQRPLGVTDPRQPTAKRQGLSQAEVLEAIRAQAGRCAIGGEPLGAQVMVDHDHQLARMHGHNPERGCVGCFRGITCNGHNAALGAFGDDPTLLRRAADYIERRRRHA